MAALRKWMLWMGMVLLALPGAARAASLEVTGEASGVGNYGLAVTMEPDPIAAAYVQENLAATSALRVRFRWRTGTMPRWTEVDPTIYSDDPILAMLHIGDTAGTPVFPNRLATLWLSVRNDQWVVWGLCRNNSGTFGQTPVLDLPNSLTDTNTFLQVEMTLTPSSSGTANGSCCVAVEGLDEVCNSTLENDQLQAVAVSLGATLPVRMPPDVTGTFHIDEVIVSN